MAFSASLLSAGLVLALLQVAVAVPWVLALTWDAFRAWLRPAPAARFAVALGGLVVVALVLGAAAAAGAAIVQQRDSLESLGRAFGSLLHLQLVADFFIVVFAAGLLCPTVDWSSLEERTRWPIRTILCAVLAVPGLFLAWTSRQSADVGTWLLAGFLTVLPGLFLVWFLSEGRPKLFAVARAAFREGYRQPMFWLFVVAAVSWLFLSPFLPYFTFGEDYIMVKELGYDTIMFAAVAFGAIAAGLSISEEIEGRTAVTLMSKPVSRRQFLLGKFLGILLACLVLIGALGWFFQGLLLYKRWFDQLPAQVLRPSLGNWVNNLGFAPEGKHLLRGLLLWGEQASEVLPGLLMSSSLVMVLVALAVALATRVPLVVNLVTCLVIYFLSNLMPVLVQTTRPHGATSQGAVQKLLYFMAQLFDALLPGLELFRVRPTVVDETTLPIGEYLQHVAAVTGYGLLFTAIVLILGLVLFEDRDLA